MITTRWDLEKPYGQCWGDPGRNIYREMEGIREEVKEKRLSVVYLECIDHISTLLDHLKYSFLFSIFSLKSFFFF